MTRLTPVEAEVQRLQGRVIGPTINENPVWKMSLNELMDLSLTFTARVKSDDRSRVWYERQLEKINREIKRRNRL